MRWPVLSLAALGLGALGLAACASDPSPESGAEPTVEADPPQPALRTVRATQSRPPRGDAASLVTKAGFEPHNVGYVVTELSTGRVVAAHNADEAFIPASVTKIGTGLAALSVLGGDHRFKTRVLSDSRIRGGVLRGDLTLQGGGDPLLRSAHLMNLCLALRRKGVRRIEGRLIADDARGPRQRGINRRQPPDAQYNPAISALSLNFNRVRLRHRPTGKPGEIALHSLPPLSGVAVEAPTPPKPLAPGWRPDIGKERTTWRPGRSILEAGSTWLPVKRPALAAGSVFRRVCARAGVTLPAPERGVASPGARTLVVHAGAPLHEVVAAMLDHSNNMVAESVGTATGRALAGEMRSLAESSAAVAQWWRRQRPDVSWERSRVRNHSGLSARSRLTPAQIVGMLRFGASRSYKTGAGDSKIDFLGLMPAAGEPGAFGGRLSGPAASLSVWAKTGTMHFASGLGGYILSDAGRRLAFAILIDDKEKRRRLDRRTRAHRNNADEARPPANALRSEIAAWRDRAKALEADLVRHWLERP